MAKYKYMEYTHQNGMVVERGDWVMAFVPSAESRFVTSAIITGINESSIRVEYLYKGEMYSARLLDHQWCFYKKATEVIVTEPRFLELINKESKWDALSSAGVDNWEGFEAAMDPGF